MIVKIGEVESKQERDEKRKKEKNDMRELIISALKLQGRVVEAPDWRHLLEEVLQLSVPEGSRKRWHDALNSLCYSKTRRAVCVSGLRKGEEYWKRYTLL